MESLLTGDPPFPRKSWMRMWGWYQEALDHAPPPAQITLKQIATDRKELYRSVPPPPGGGGEVFPYLCHPAQSTTSYLHRRRSSGRYGYYGVTVQEFPTGCAPGTSRSVCGSTGRQNRQRG